MTLDDLTGPFAWGNLENVTHLRHLWIAGQPDEEGLTAAREAGVTLVLDLRPPGEREWDEATAAGRLGLGYHNIAVAKEGPFQEAAFSEIEAFVMSHRDDQILLHCSSGNRAAAWLTAHLVQSHGMPFAEALTFGRHAGISKAGIVEKTASYLGETGTDTAPDDDRVSKEINRDRERMVFDPTGCVENHEQKLYGLRYSTMAWRLGEDDPFHEELGYWLWDAEAKQVLRCFRVPRGVTVIAGETVEPGARIIELAAEVGSETYGISFHHTDEHTLTRAP